MKKVSDIGRLQRKADSLMQEWGKKEYKACLICGKTMQVLHHFVPKSVSARLRYEHDNLIPLCNGCHMRLHQSGDPKYEFQIIQSKPEGWYEKLSKLRQEIIKVNKEYYLGQIAKYQELLK